MAAVVGAVKSYFSKSGFSSLQQYVSSSDDSYEAMYESYTVLQNVLIMILVIAGIVIGFMAVPNLCPDKSDIGKNARFLMYILLILTGGQIGWFLGVLWVLGFNICR
jgi:hypothetical protein